MGGVHWLITTARVKIIQLWVIAEEKHQNGRKLIEKSRISHMRSFVIVIRSAYFGA